MATIISIGYADLDKSALQTFNRLAYEGKVSGSLVVSCLLGFLDHYSHDIKLRHININLIIVLKVLFFLNQAFSYCQRIKQHLRALYKRQHVC